ncbi:MULTISPECIES: ethanolamine utilization microcompartment protein EutL [Paraclostridium]|jgi:ethanolamine utilization protein EutL|uniref:Ethanolamine utilization microcompartment protein EutL n=3 Tax=Paraclostridium TaxID=1849822 RepID=A0A1X2JJQ9_PARBF|nr:MULTISPECIES: ethanolamine utilization microcompartment protein EutL [Clostridia]KGJ50521.1 ethanolamine utilization protein EutL [Clostridium sp. NCR]RDC51177.1 ethanolamine utilization microcompartment protein EutL [Acinetobacter sp. RIT592]EQK42259.1 ethanolamine utilization protein EutL [[Clostridium] bifermentans ATCC 638] [Paraclostridium bifermentans ATCC 638 = DSM 14991]EQK46690.1 ethanolamine utilization protein EutL [[Clostridium] bifermentans ATCC 19299] [Paraclostridium biferment
MKNDAIRPNVLGVKIISNVSPEMAKKLNLEQHHKSLGLITADCDDVTYTALDEATKAAEVDVVYAKSMYAGAANASTKLAGEVIGIIAGPSPAEVRSGLNAVLDFMEYGATFISANDDDSIAYYAHCVSRTGTYLSKVANIREGEALAYLVAPPLEAMYALDAALKAADVSLCELFEPPTETNFAGALLTGSQSACKAACDAFAQAVIAVADNPTGF